LLRAVVGRAVKGKVIKGKAIRVGVEKARRLLLGVETLPAPLQLMRPCKPGTPV